MKKGHVHMIQVWILKVHKGELMTLLLKRKRHLGNFWQPVCGRVEVFDKSMKHACAREIKEETNIPTHHLWIKDTGFFYSYAKHYLTGETVPEHVEHLFYTIIDELENPIRLSCEHDSYRWVSLDDACDMLKYSDNRKALAVIDKLLNDGFQFLS